jgi:hypothetical protein
MFSLFCVVGCVLAQLINSAVHPAAILLRKRRVVDFIDGDVPCYRIRRVLQSRDEEEGELKWLYSFPGWKAWPLLRIRCSLIRFSVSDVGFLLHSLL